ncbi:hypothetical protein PAPPERLAPAPP_01200 [Brevundimonas phage vB_BpoS-Papperlapapp]|uniref:Uncharacterized protein n=2 Tax=Marchewkavirus TaxID=3425052 RepID=A0A9E7MP98_9CAUD|nr:hypothetical protein KABACHOK_05430 [Brevundimonas phage vB_BpoS-Kabachok]USN14489.1 hypothetical protein DOMOVOI_00140 [Brevundimonas phage vB_BpoS-Domovoi]USN15862.1 hypothetical protein PAPPERLAPAPP_01200 [Brevundimonas phage vB_BpoS-Papperlapapp]
MKLILERHAYAPELNTAHILRKGRVVAELPVPGATSIKEARAKLFPRIRPGRVAFYASHYPEPLKWLERQYGGRIDSYQKGLDFLRAQRAKLTPEGRATLKTRLIG